MAVRWGQYHLCCTQVWGKSCNDIFDTDTHEPTASCNSDHPTESSTGKTKVLWVVIAVWVGNDLAEASHGEGMFWMSTESYNQRTDGESLSGVRDRVLPQKRVSGKEQVTL